MKRKLKLYAPKWMSEAAQAEYKRVLPLLIERKTFTEADMTTFECYCVSVGVLRDAQKMVDDEGLTAPYQGSTRPSGSLRLQFDAMAKVRSLAIELGLTPLSRSKAKRAEDVETDSDLQDLDL